MSEPIHARATAPSRSPIVMVGGFAVGGAAIAGIVAWTSLAAPPPSSSGAPEEVLLAPRVEPARTAPERLVPRVHARLPHDPGAFTQGLVVVGERTFESTGLVGRSSLREVDRTSGRVIRSVDLDPPNFAEGLAVVGDELIQLTWQQHVAFVYGLDDFEPRREHEYNTEGWGLCYDGAVLAMSDGSSTLFMRDPTTFAVTRRIPVMRDGAPVRNLNELECVGPHVYANVWQTNEIVRIRKADGVVDAIVDASSLEPSDPGVDVLNGIAYVPESQHFLITGKLWPTMYEVTFEAAP